MLSSALTANDIKQANIIYIGYFENLGILANYFNGSQYNFDTITEQLSSKNQSQEFQAPAKVNHQYIDYGLFAKVDGPRSNKIYIISGYTDSSLLWLSWFLTSTGQGPKKDSEQSVQKYLQGQEDNFELLFKIPSLNGQDMGHELISNSKIDSDNIWN